MKHILLASALFVSLSSVSVAGEYDFNFKNKNHMRGAWMMCATTGFTKGDCPKVLRRCFRPPLIKCRRGKCKTICTGVPNFFVSENDVKRALNHAKSLTQ